KGGYRMNDVELVALWTGLISSIVGIVLSIVAIWFSVHVNRRSDEISNKTIQALQKIESAVEQQSDDTRELIKAAWDKLLGTMDRASAPNYDVAAKEIAGGIASELRAELGAMNPLATAGAKDSSVERMESLLKQFESTLVTQLRSRNALDKPGETLESLIRQISELSPRARAMISEIRGHHISLDEYRRLRQGPIADALAELRLAGLIIPVQHSHKDGKKEPCYYFPPGISRILAA